MKQKTPRLYSSAPLENNDLEQILEKRLTVVSSFNNSVSNITEKITYFKDRKYKAEEKYENNKLLITILKSFDRFVFIATTSSSITLFLKGIGLIVIPISTRIACVVTISSKILYEIVVQK